MVVAAKEARHITRDPELVFIALAFPVAMLLLFGTIFSTRPSGIRVAVQDLDGSLESRRMLRELAATPDFVLAEGAPEAALEAGSAILAVVIPRDFGRRLSAGREARVGLFVDGSDLVAARAVESYLEAFGASVLREPVSPGPTPAAVTWFNPERSDPVFLVPGAIAALLFGGSVIFTSLSLVREKSSGTWDALAATPIGDAALLAGKLLPYLVQMAVLAVLVLAVAVAVFHVPFRGGASLVAGATLAIILAGIGLGATFSAISRDEEFCWYYISTLVLLPCLTLSGIIYPLSSMPPTVRAVAHTFPVSHYLEILRGALLRGAGLAELWPEALVLAAFAAGSLGLAIVCLRRSRGSP